MHIYRCIYMYMHIYIYECMILLSNIYQIHDGRPRCAGGRGSEPGFVYRHMKTHMYVYIYICIYM